MFIKKINLGMEMPMPSCWCPNYHSLDFRVQTNTILWFDIHAGSTGESGKPCEGCTTTQSVLD